VIFVHDCEILNKYVLCQINCQYFSEDFRNFAG
jgi:hypothetical protein